MAANLSARLDLEAQVKERLPARLRRTFDRLDSRIAGFMEAYGITLLRLALGLVFVWFGALKLAGRSPVEGLVADTAYIVPDEVAVYGLGVWEVGIGLGLLLPVALRLTLLLLWLQLAGTFLALAIAPGRAFQDGNPLLLTETGEFIIKNLVLISAGFVIGSTVRRGKGAEGQGVKGRGLTADG